MRDFERIELLIKEDEKLTKAFLNEVRRIWDLADHYDKKGQRMNSNICIAIGNSYTRILLEKTGAKTKEQIDREAYKQDKGEQQNDEVVN